MWFIFFTVIQNLVALKPCSCLSVWFARWSIELEFVRTYCVKLGGGIVVKNSRILNWLHCWVVLLLVNIEKMTREFY